MKGFCLEVSGDYACFTRPEMKVERVSYEVITPSAARAIFEAVLWKPAIIWNIKKIEVLNPIKWISVRRNEIGAIASEGKDCIYAEENRQQRAGLFLKDVKYRITAEFEFVAPEKRFRTRNVLPDYLISEEDKNDLRKDETPAKYAAMFERRARKGQCFNQPYLGCREFSANFKLVNDGTEKIEPIQDTKELGLMLYDIDFTNVESPQPMFFSAEMKKGIVNVPDWNSKEVLK
uniref:pre-crRNA processing endonuclease n=1 Tax=Endomicrobium trichonymphae TaxID=1408204 RepID=A0A1C9ZTA8_ENDTX|nr:CRISPR-associated protein cas5 [Candidatus Endomicrobium trichonymphae]